MTDYDTEEITVDPDEEEYLIKDNILEKPPFELFMFLKIFYINSLNIQMKM